VISPTQWPLSDSTQHSQETDIHAPGGIRIHNLSKRVAADPPSARYILRVIRKGKAVPLQAWSGPEGSRKLRFPGFMTTAQDGGKVVSVTHRPPLSPGNKPGTHFC